MSGIKFLRKDGTPTFAEGPRFFERILKTNADNLFSDVSEKEIKELSVQIFDKMQKYGKKTLENEEVMKCVRDTLSGYPDLLIAYENGSEKKTIAVQRQQAEEMARIMSAGDKSNGTVDSDLASTKRALKYEAVEKVIYREFVLTKEEREALNDGYIYIHDMGARRDMINCCLFDMKTVLSGGFEMGNVWYEEPKTLREAFDVIASVTLTNASQIYGGFTIPQIDDLLSFYAEKSYQLYYEKYRNIGLEETEAEKLAVKEIEEDFDFGFKSLEYKFNTVISSRGDYPFITISFGICRNRFANMAVKSAIKTRMNGQGKEGHKRPVLFPKLVFLFDEGLHGSGCELEELFDLALECSGKMMYPEFLSLTGEGYVSEFYKKYGEVISPMCCRAFLSPWYENGNMQPADDNDRPVFVGRFNFGVVSLHLPMILAKSKKEKKDFYEVLDGYLEMIRNIHKKTYLYLSKIKAKSNPVAFMQGGFYNGNLKADDPIEPLLKSATASFGVTALNELQRLYNGRSLYEDGEFALDVMQYINKKVDVFKNDDKILYNVYGTPAEKLCGLQVKQFRNKYGIIKNVSDREYVSNSFHCHVSESITPIEKQDRESDFWDMLNGGKIQYVRITNPDNRLALKSIVLHAMKLGLYEGINLSLVYCDKCGAESNSVQHIEQCPKCGSVEITKIERMCGFLSYTRIHGHTRLNEAKMAEIKERKSM